MIPSELERVRLQEMSTAELRLEWVRVSAQVRRLAREIEDLDSSAIRTDILLRAEQLRDRYRILDRTWDYIDDLLIAREDELEDDEP